MRVGRVALAVLLCSCALVAACGGAAALSTAPSATVAPSGLIGQVASGGYVIFFRHTARDASAISIEDLTVADKAEQCVPGSELTPVGMSDAVGIGQAFRRYGMRVGHVYASPACRTIQMARLAFGEQYEARRELTYPGMWTSEEATSLTPGLRLLLGTPPSPGTSVVLLSHNDVITQDRVGVTLTFGQGDSAVFRPSGDGSFELVGTISLQEWLK